MSPNTLLIELLCAHHDLSAFDCGNSEINLAAHGFASRVKARDTEEFHAIVVADRERHVFGIAVTMDVMVGPDYEAGGKLVDGPCLFCVLLAVDKNHDGLVRSLLDEIDSTRIRRFAIRTDLVGEIASPQQGPRSLTRYLTKHGFRPLHNDNTTWYRLPDYDM